MKLNLKNTSFICIVILKLVFSILFIYHLKDENSFCFIKEPNTEIGTEEGYLSTIENLLENGEYYYDGIFSNGKMYAPRVPGVSLSYLIFRYFFSKITAINCLIIFQTLVFLTSVFFFSKIVLKSNDEIKKGILFVIIFGNSVEGWATIVVLILLFFGIQFLFLGVIGEYLWRTLSQVQKKSMYIIDDTKMD